jgi:DNA-binding transcriptional LysR family regulator
MEFNQVRYFLALARSLNFTRAAEACNVTQPALTKAIQKLEEEFGGLLFYRERSLTQLTELGQLVLPLLEQMSAAAQTAKTQAVAFHRREAAPLRLGLDGSVSVAVLTPVLRELGERIAGFELDMRQHSTPALFELLLGGDIDAAVVDERDKVPDRLNRWVLLRERLKVLCAPCHPLSGLAEIPLAALAEVPILQRAAPECAYRRIVEALCAAAGIEPCFRHSATSEEQLHEMARAALGIAVWAGRVPPSGLVARPLAGPAARRGVMLVAVAGRQYGPAVAAFLKLMRARCWDECAPAAMIE